MIWLDILNKTKQGNDFPIFRGKLINFHEDHDNEVEQSNTHLDLLTE